MELWEESGGVRLIPGLGLGILGAVVTPAFTLAELDAGARRAAVAEAASALAAGRLVVLPTDTVYGIAASASSPAALLALEAVARPCSVAPHEPMCWHAPSAQAVLDAFAIEVPVHRRLIRRLCPGAARFLIELPEEALAAGLARLGVASGVMDRAGVVSVRVPNHSTALAVLRAAGVPVVAKRLAAAGWTPDRDASAALADDRAALAGIAAVLDDGPTPFGGVSTAIRLNRAGGWSIDRAGVLDARSIARRAEHHVLFVCTGNTCRSPMAEAIARREAGELSSRAGGVRFVVASAGVAAGGGPTTPEALEALRSLGIEAPEQRSRSVTARMLADADAIYTMSRHHADAIREMDPTVPVALLDPDGGEVPDPIGLPPVVYEQTAMRLRELIRRRLEEAWA